MKRAWILLALTLSVLPACAPGGGGTPTPLPTDTPAPTVAFETFDLDFLEPIPLLHVGQPLVVGPVEVVVEEISRRPDSLQVRGVRRPVGTPAAGFNPLFLSVSEDAGVVLYPLVVWDRGGTTVAAVSGAEGSVCWLWAEGQTPSAVAGPFTCTWTGLDPQAVFGIGVFLVRRGVSLIVPIPAQLADLRVLLEVPGFSPPPAWTGRSRLAPASPGQTVDLGGGQITLLEARRVPAEGGGWHLEVTLLERCEGPAPCEVYGVTFLRESGETVFDLLSPQSAIPIRLNPGEQVETRWRSAAALEQPGAAGLLYARMTVADRALTAVFRLP